MSQLVRDFGDPVEEARSCRSDSALFDFSFVYRLRLSGANVIAEMEDFQPRRVSDMVTGQIRYSVKLNRQGRVRSDLTLWRLGEGVFEIMSGCQADAIELLSLSDESFRVEDLSEQSAIIAIQGDNALLKLGQFMDVEAIKTLPYFHFTGAQIAGHDCVIGRLGYSGEKGFEIIVEQSHKSFLWERLCDVVRPAGLAALDILRIEAGFFLFTHECRIAPGIDELGLASFFDLDEADAEIRFTAFKASSRADMTLWQPASSTVRRPDAGEISVTSACYSPYFDSVIGLGFVPTGNKNSIHTDPDGVFHSIEIQAAPLFDPAKIKPRQGW